ncbi:glyceraldehyde 3-phosphate dehydrogenase (NAD(P)+) [Natronoarchaeum philippinense]|uniref:Glyceraldehyde-3-phosphate dehydrogenase n=1 Tax=Natronoarchaeum philippinense TaxID=558529 RepID=A0A285NRR8_NATPI|nr:type II glyceraldehyde-3-phosphate dehydrogenase [Natronoarchaeum philippinense]SNZ11667.1 glyceraldehyde 3-phosphate dehydrogenase (NAD(P)+) [Natronoarchaeum philippinense]
MLHVGVNGYGTIGKRVADAVRSQPDMTVEGVTKTGPDFAAERASVAGYDLHATDEDAVDAFRAAGLDIAGTVEDLVDASDVIVDATPGGVGAEYRSLYEAHDTPAVFQGAESPDVAEMSFNARSNFEDARDAEYVRVVSCNTTGLSRLLAPLSETYGVKKARATLVRRGGDPDQSGRGPINDILPNPVEVPSHHGPDVQTVFPDLSIDTLGLTVPATLMHVHSVNVTLESAPDVRDVRDLLDAESRVFLVPRRSRIESCGELREYARDAGRPRGDIWENCVWEESITVEGRDFYCFQAIHQEADVVPENVDALRAMFDLADREESVARTNAALGLTDEAVRIEAPGVAADGSGRNR